MSTPSQKSALRSAVLVPYVAPRCARLQSLTSAFCQAAGKGFPVVIRSTLSANTQDCCEGIHSFLSARLVVSASCRVRVQESTVSKDTWRNADSFLADSRFCTQQAAGCSLPSAQFSGQSFVPQGFKILHGVRSTADMQPISTRHHAGSNPAGRSNFCGGRPGSHSRVVISRARRLARISAHSSPPRALSSARDSGRWPSAPCFFGVRG
jgi:hypothetical protein